MRRIDNISQQEKSQIYEEYINGSVAREIAVLHDTGISTVVNIIKEMIPNERVKKNHRKAEYKKLALDIFDKGERKLSEIAKYSKTDEASIKEFFESRGHEVSDVVKGKTKTYTKDRVISLLKDGASASEIAKAYGFSTQYIYKVKKAAEERGIEFPLPDFKVMLLTEKEINEKIQENDKIIKTTKKQTRDITIVKLYTEGLKYKEIAEKMKCSVSLVIKVLGSQRKKRSVRPRRQSEEDFIKTALQMKKQYSEGITVKQIMKAYDMTEKQVRHRLNKKIEKGENNDKD